MAELALLKTDRQRDDDDGDEEAIDAVLLADGELAVSRMLRHRLALGFPGIVRVVRRRSSRPRRCRGHGLSGGGQETHTQQITDERKTQHYTPDPQSGHGHCAEKTPRRKSA